MLRQTFLHLPGIGPKAEISLWRQGCESWDDLVHGKFRLGSASTDIVRAEAKKSIRALDEGEHQYFRKTLRARHAWRAWPEFRDKCVYLDIETDGGTGPESVTVIGMYDGQEFVALTKGDNLEEFRDRISQFSMIVTFFGTGFDLPVLQRRFPGVIMDQIHLDLCPTLRELGIRGGLKRIEQDFGLERSEDTAGLTGWDAVLLWRRAQRGDEGALARLIAYNREDCVNLEPLAMYAYGKLKRAVNEACGERRPKARQDVPLPLGPILPDAPVDGDR